MHHGQPKRKPSPCGCRFARAAFFDKNGKDVLCSFWKRSVMWAESQTIVETSLLLALFTMHIHFVRCKWASPVNWLYSDCALTRKAGAKHSNSISDCDIFCYIMPHPHSDSSLHPDRKTMCICPVLMFHFRMHPSL